MSIRRAHFLIGASALLVLLPSCTGPAPAVKEDTSLVSAEALSYRNEPLAADSGAPRAIYDAADPGESERVERSFENAPPVIPHSTEDLLPITLAENACIECHAPENAVDMGAPATPASHSYDIRRRKQLNGVNPANYDCTICHAPQARVPGLVENTFEPFYRAQELRKASNLLEILDEGVK